MSSDRLPYQTGRHQTSRRETWDAEAVASLRSEAGMSQAELSRLLGVRQQTVSEWETGLHRPRGASVRMLSMVAEQVAEYRTRAGPTRGGGPGDGPGA